MPRIVVVGSFSTGKTTLAEAAAARLDLPLLPEVAREVAALGFPLDKDATAETQTLIFLRQLYNEMTHAEFVSDRSLVDTLAYGSWIADHNAGSMKALWESCVAVAHHQLRSQYSHVFYLPIEFPIVPDGLRPMDPAFQRDIDDRVLAVLRAHDVAFRELRGSAEERLDAMLRAL